MSSLLNRTYGSALGPEVNGGELGECEARAVKTGGVLPPRLTGLWFWYGLGCVYHGNLLVRPRPYAGGCVWGLA